LAETLFTWISSRTSVNRLGHACAAHGHAHGRAGGAAHHRHEFVEPLAARGAPIDGDDLIARADPGPRRGGALDGRDHGHVVGALGVHLDADAAEFALGLALEERVLRWSHVGRVRVELGHHALDGPVGYLGALRGIDVLVLDEDEHARELIEGRVGACGLRGGAGKMRCHRSTGERGQHQERGTGPA
jgi:hypothetical protein